MVWHPSMGAWMEGDAVRFRVWAPLARSVTAVIGKADAVPLTKQADGFWTGLAPSARPGDLYAFQLEDRPALPDPCSRRQPEGVHGRSEIVDPRSFVWSDADWKGVGIDDAIIYELHVGAFSPQGNFQGVIERLPALVDLGVSVIELMPVAECPGTRNWGYDGVGIFAPAHGYGRPDDLRQLVDESHRLGLAVILDVVYNHLGPDGNYLGSYSPFYFHQEHTAWGGQTLNFDGEHCEQVRAFFIENALHWIHEYHMDGLRLDATHAIIDEGSPPFLAELAERVHAACKDRQVLLIAEDHRNLATLMKPPAEGGWGVDAVWADDFHHELRRLLAGDHEGYYRDYTGSPADLARTIRQGWFYCGQQSIHFGAPRGSDPRGIPPRRFVCCLQNHDQIGNRALGERLHHQIDLAAYRAAVALLLCIPATPLLFMGQEWAADAPFLFFTDHHEELGPKVTAGRRKEFAYFAAFSSPAAQAAIPDCQAESTFLRCRLNWDEREKEPHAGVLRLHRELVGLRRSLPALRANGPMDFDVDATEGGIVLLRKSVAAGSNLAAVVQLKGGGSVNLLEHRLLQTSPQRRWEPILTTEDSSYTLEARLPRIDIVENGVTIQFQRPGAVLLKEVAIPAAVPAPASGVEAPFPNEDDFRRYLRQHRRVPVATYRLQLQPAFTFRAAAAIVPYLAKLGITDVYCSPYLYARPGSTHGYDICDYCQFNPELGGETDYQAFVEELSAHGMGHLLDFVPNHMAVDCAQNLWWRDMLENGRASPYACFFDVDWEPEKPELKNKVLLPFLGDQYGEVLERGEFELVFDMGNLRVVHGQVSRPIDPALYPRVLGPRVKELEARLAPDDRDLQEFLSILTALDRLPAASESAPERSAERLRESRLARERLANLVHASATIREHIEANVRRMNGQAGRPGSFDELHELLEAQPYRLAYWKTAGHEINYRRFFDINQLAGLRMEEPTVFAATHGLVLRLIRENKITGLRLDHIDGLFDPAGYLERLQAAIFEERAAAYLGIAGDRSEEWRKKINAWRDRERRADPGGAAEHPLYVVVEKILTGDEALPSRWPIDGTTGYDFSNDVNRLFVDPQQARAMRRVYERFAGPTVPLADVVYECKRTISGTSLASELNVLAQMLNRLSEADRRTRDFTLYSLRQALREIAVNFPAYRTYVDAGGATSADAQLLERAIRRARTRNPAMEGSVFEFIRTALLPDRDQLATGAFQDRLRFAMKFQQYTGPLQAKGLEDTAFYIYNVLISLNEVGGDPQRFGGALSQFHEANQRRLSQFPATMLATATHDTKRGEDARARLDVLSEMPDSWRRHLSRWTRINARRRTTVDGAPAPSRNDEYLFYQALLGAWPAEPVGTTHFAAPPEIVRRMSEFMQKAVKEAKVHTSWISPNEAYDQAVTDFVENTLAGSHSRRFLAEFSPFQQRVARHGMIHSLAQLALKVASPGVPDFYQGTESWDCSLVDPDNRHPVDFSQRQEMLDTLDPPHAIGLPGVEKRSAVLAEMLENWHDGRIKAFVTMSGVRLRRQLPRLFRHGDYVPLEVEGEWAEHIVALARCDGTECVMAVVPRLIAELTSTQHWLPIGADVWKSTRIYLPTKLAAEQYENILTTEHVPSEMDGEARCLFVRTVLRSCPVAILRSR